MLGISKTQRHRICPCHATSSSLLLSRFTLSTLDLGTSDSIRLFLPLLLHLLPSTNPSSLLHSPSPPPPTPPSPKYSTYPSPSWMPTERSD
ncbi:hypothetical protein SISSUDRAFT_254450 [Sistotremastrum suecicum HHB10207 ss-3]|uniref:Uncharacterized protein n=1 Tax=Sistotremastrum suecicum HHB10207 ss-3 TaxID=1314776 RepID=A0A165ZV94_9AGAM|nr:hypothetical protein SISSUDRAFT_254450 [Sistotremastrum suecicum HHB10207 ss-3]